MLPLRFFQQSDRETMEPREEKTTGLTAADWVRMCRAAYTRGFCLPNDMPQNEREDRPANRSRREVLTNRDFDSTIYINRDR
jgi:hypothetical protein